MKNILTIQYNARAFDLSMLLLRLMSGLLMINIHGYDKIINFSIEQYEFYNFLKLGSKISLLLAIFAETFCACIILGLFTRLAAIPLIITMLVAVFGFNSGKPLIQSEVALLYLIPFAVLLFCGPGRVSIDAIFKRQHINK